MLAGLGAGKKWDRVSPESNSSARGGWGKSLWAAAVKDGTGRWEGGTAAGQGSAAVGGFSSKLPRDSKLQPHLCLNTKRMGGEKSSAGRFGGEKIRGTFSALKSIP